MIVAPLLGAALVVNVATTPLTAPAAGEANLTLQQKAAATEPLVRTATDCIVHAVMSDPRFAAVPHAQVGDLIVESIADVAPPIASWIRKLGHDPLSLEPDDRIHIVPGG